MDRSHVRTRPAYFVGVAAFSIAVVTYMPWVEYIHEGVRSCTRTVRRQPQSLLVTRTVVDSQSHNRDTVQRAGFQCPTTELKR